MVFQYTSPLTQFLNGRLTKDGNMNGKTIRAIWLDAFDIDWPNDLSLLPNPIPPNRLDGLLNEDFAKVRSRSMYDRLCRRLPDATESNTCFAMEDKVVNICVIKEWPFQYTLYHKRMDSKSFCLLHVPMHNMWTYVLNDRIRQYPYACAQDCIIEGHIDLLKHLIKSNIIELRRINNLVEIPLGDESMNYSMDVAAHQGHLDVLKMMHDAGCDSITFSAMDYAAKNGHLDVVKFLHENRTEGCTSRAMNAAAENGYLDVVKWLHENRTEGCTDLAMNGAVRCSHAHVVRFLLENRTDGFDDAVFIYCKSPEIAEILIKSISHERRCKIMAVAMSNGWEGCGIDALKKSLDAQT